MVYDLKFQVTAADLTCTTRRLKTRTGWGGVGWQQFQKLIYMYMHTGTAESANILQGSSVPRLLYSTQAELAKEVGLGLGADQSAT